MIDFHDPRPIFDAFLNIWVADTGRYLIGAGGVFLLVNTLGRSFLKGRQIRAKRPPVKQAVREILTSLRTAFIFALIGSLIWLGERHGVMTIYGSPDQLGWVWFLISAVILIIGHDAWFYWTHRLIHRPRFFRKWHRVHHLSFNPTPWASYAFNIREAGINAIYLPLMLLALPVSVWAILIFTTHMILRNAMGHCGYELFPRTRDGRPLFDWLTTTTHHDLHHEVAGYNFGLYFTFWDRVMGTEHPDYHTRFASAVRASASDTPPFHRGGWQRTVGAICLALGVTVVPSTARSQGLPPQMASIVGHWAAEGYSLVTEIHPCLENEVQLCGTLIWVWDPEEIDESKIGMLMLEDFLWKGREWVKGKLHNPDDGRTYRGTIQQLNPAQIKLEGCAFVVCRDQLWRRLESLPHIADILSPDESGVEETVLEFPALPQAKEEKVVSDTL